MSVTVAIVAGGGGPLGHATAVALAAGGLTVVAVDRTEQALSDLPGEIRRMRQQGSGAIVHVAARPGIEPASGMGAYSVSKAALVHLTRILDIELRPQGIRVNAVAPQLLDTPRDRAMFPAEVMAHAVAPEAIAGVIAFLVSDAAAAVSEAILPACGA